MSWGDGTPRWEHTGKRPNYLVPPPPTAPPIEPHEPDPHYNAPGDWVCRTCGEKVKLSAKQPNSAQNT